MIEPYLIRSRLFLALGVPAPLCPLLHAWAVVENRAFCHEFMGALLCLNGSEKAVRVAVARKLDALAHFFKTFDYNLGSINRGGGKEKRITTYGAFTPNRAVFWIEEQLAGDPDISNPFVAIDRYVLEAAALHIPKIQRQIEKKKKRKPSLRRESAIPRNTLGHRSVALEESADSTFRDALLWARFGFEVFAVWGVTDGVCHCPRGSECPTAGKHPIPKGWQNIATTYEPTLFKFWQRHPCANIGIATGRNLATGGFLTVIDSDTRHFGHGSISHLERNELCPLPATREHSNGGGPHKFFTYPRGFRSRPGALGQGIDIQSFGKFVVAPGSTHKSGRLYEVTLDLPIARLPDEWADHIDAIRNKTLPLIPEGQRRAKLISWAGGMVHSGMHQDLILTTLRDRRDKRCERGSHSFTDDDLRGMIAYCVRQESQKEKEQAA